MVSFLKNNTMSDNTIEDHINIVFTPISFEAGMAGSQRLKNLVSLLSDHNINCKNLVLSGINLKTQPFINSSMSVLLAYNNNLYSILKLPFKVFATLKSFKITGKNILYNYGYIHIQNFYIILIAKVLGYKIVVDIVEDNFIIKNFKHRWAKIRVSSSLFFLKHLSSFVNGVIVINEQLKKLASEYISSNSPIVVIPISIDPFEFKEISKENNYKIFYGGSFNKKDGLEFLLRASEKIVEIFPESKLIITGKGSKRDMIYFNEMLDRVKHKDSVILKGYVSREAYIELLQSTDVHCMTRINSDFANAGFPFKLGEMLASGKPVIATRVGEIEKYLVDGINAILISPESIEELADKINYVFTNRKEAEIIGKNGRRTAYDNFNLAMQYPKILNFLNAV